LRSAGKPKHTGAAIPQPDHNAEVLTMLEASLARMTEFIDADLAAIYYYDPQSGCLFLEAHQGMPEGLLGKAATIPVEQATSKDGLGQGPLGEGGFGDVVASRLAALMQEAGARSQVTVPLRFGEAPQGTMVVGRHDERPFTPEEVKLLRAVACQMQLGAQQARLYCREMKLRQELEREIKKRSEFLRALVHELKTPVTAVMASSEILTAELQDKTLLALARNLYRSAENLNMRIDELLDVARGELGMLRLNRTAVDPIPLLRGSASDLAPLVSSYRQSLTVELPPSLPFVWADDSRLRQVVFNLLANASKFTPEGGQITLRARVEKRNLIVEVQDNGPGIPEEDQARLFDPYYRLERDREHLSGLGLGLALSKTLVELHRGRIWISSGEGRGSTFAFSVPLATERQLEQSVGQRPSNARIAPVTDSPQSGEC